MHVQSNRTRTHSISDSVSYVLQ